MGKYDGMDPKLVRDLLTEVKHAATQMRAVEDRVRLTMSRAGLSTQTTHRPAQVAEAAGEMVRDVDGRLGVLEKRVDPPRGTGDVPPSGAGATDDDEPKDVRGDRDRYENPRAGDKPDEPPSKGEDGRKTGQEPRTGADPRTDSEGRTGSDGRSDSDGRTGPDGRSDSDGRTGPDGRSDTDGRTDSDGGGGSDGKAGSADGKTCDDAEDRGVGKGTGTDGSTGDQPADEPKDDDQDSRRDRGAEGDGGATGTPAKDHPDGTGVTKPQVVVVDGVKVLQIPLDPPTAEQLEDLLENTGNVQPAEMPKMPADTTTGSNAGAWSGHEVRPDGYGSAGVTPIDDPPANTGTDDACDSGTNRTPGGGGTSPGGTSPGGAGPTPGGTAPGGADSTPGGTTPSGTGSTPGGTTPGGTGAAPDGGAGVTIPPTPPAGESNPPGGAASGGSSADAYGAGSDAVGDDGRGSGSRPDGGSASGSRPDGGPGAAARWADDGSDVVSVDVTPPDLDAIRTLIENHRDIQPQEMPSVQVPPGEYGTGRWTPEDIRPDGRPGAVDPGTPERSA
jgi:hypothetical protein